MSPLDENHQALLIRLYRMAGDDEAAAGSSAAAPKALRAELGVAPGPAVQAAMRETRSPAGSQVAERGPIEALIEAGTAAVSAGAAEAGVDSLRTAVQARRPRRRDPAARQSRLVLAEALIHALGGLDEEGLATLDEADEIALAHGDCQEWPGARAELGYVDFLRGTLRPGRGAGSPTPWSSPPAHPRCRRRRRPTSARWKATERTTGVPQPSWRGGHAVTGGGSPRRRPTPAP